MIQIKYYNSEGNSYPQLVEIGPTTVYLRKNVHQEEERFEDENGEISFSKIYRYEEAKIPLTDFNKYSNELLFQNQMNNNSFQLTIMEALADLSLTISEQNTLLNNIFQEGKK